MNISKFLSSLIFNGVRDFLVRSFLNSMAEKCKTIAFTFCIVILTCGPSNYKRKFQPQRYFKDWKQDARLMTWLRISSVTTTARPAISTVVLDCPRLFGTLIPNRTRKLRTRWRLNTQLAKDVLTSKKTWDPGDQFHYWAQYCFQCVGAPRRTRQKSCCLRPEIRITNSNGSDLMLKSTFLCFMLPEVYLFAIFEYSYFVQSTDGFEMFQIMILLTLRKMRKMSA